MKNFVNKISKFYKDAGLFVTLAFIVHRLLSKLSAKSGCFLYFIYDQPFKVAKQTNSQPKRPSQVNYRWLDSYDESLMQLPRPTAVLNQRFEQQSQCVLAEVEDEIRACAWFTTETYIEDEVRCVFDFSSYPDRVWDYDIFVFPKYRISRLFLRLWQTSEQYLLDQGYKSTLSRIMAYNRPSVRSHQGLGAKKIGWSCFICIFQFQILISSMKPYFHISISRNRYPNLKIKIE